jgi:hypothetical protein
MLLKMLADSCSMQESPYCVEQCVGSLNSREFQKTKKQSVHPTLLTLFRYCVASFLHRKLVRCPQLKQVAWMVGKICLVMRGWLVHALVTGKLPVLVVLCVARVCFVAFHSCVSCVAAFGSDAVTFDFM